MERWCETNAIGSLHGRCRVHRAEILRLRGRCEEAEIEVSAACEELRPYLRRELGWPLTELGHSTSSPRETATPPPRPASPTPSAIAAALLVTTRASSAPVSATRCSSAAR